MLQTYHIVDRVCTLTWALGSPKVQATEQFGYNDRGLDINKASIMHEAGYTMNNLLHNEIIIKSPSLSYIFACI